MVFPDLLSAGKNCFYGEDYLIFLQ